MKKFITAVLMLSVVFFSCNQAVKGEYATVVLDLDGSSSGGRAIGQNGLPYLHNTHNNDRSERPYRRHLCKRICAGRSRKYRAAFNYRRYGPPPRKSVKRIGHLERQHNLYG